MRVGLIQLNGSNDPVANLDQIQSLTAKAVADGAQFVGTPEVSNCLSSSRTHQIAVLQLEEDDQTLKALTAMAQEHGIWLLIGSIALKTTDPDGRFANRSFLIDPNGIIKARYDKIHMFDVTVSETETYRESKGYRPGATTAVTKTPLGIIGQTVCYDIRFPHLFRDLAQAGAQIITVPAAFSAVTGAGHWHVLLRARAIETGCFIIAPAQIGQHDRRNTYGHSLVVNPWGKVLLDMGEMPGWACVDIDLDEVAEFRQKIPSLSHDREYAAPILTGDDRND